VPNFYGLTISTAVLISILVAKSLVNKKNEDTFWGIAVWTLIFGILGARIYHVADYIEYYSKFPIEILKIWEGGMGIWGAIAGGILGISIYLRTKSEKILPWLDIISVAMPLGQAIGRWGNFFNKEIFGLPTKLPWGIYIPQANRPEKYFSYERFHPLFFYESILNIFLFFILFKVYKSKSKKWPAGIFLSIYLSEYSIIRFFLEFLRIDPWKIILGDGLVLNVSQCISILVLSLSLVFIRSKFKK